MAKLKLGLFWLLWFITNLVWTPFEWLVDHIGSFLDELASFMIKKGKWRN